MLRRREQDAGFTLLELMLSIAILGILMAAFVGLMFATMTANNETKSRLDGTRAEQISSVYFGRDIQAAQGADGIVTGVAARCGAGTAVLEVRGTSYDPVSLASKVTVVSYVFSTATVDGVTTGVLQRRSCEAAVVAGAVLSADTGKHADGGARTPADGADTGLQSGALRGHHDLGEPDPVAERCRRSVHARRRKEDDMRIHEAQDTCR